MIVNAVRISTTAQVSVQVQHILSVEVDPKKRDFIMAARGWNSDMHLFGDVEAFASPDEEHYCFSCQKNHKLPNSLDVLATGPSCKNLSRMNKDRARFAGVPWRKKKTFCIPKCFLSDYSTVQSFLYITPCIIHYSHGNKVLYNTLFVRCQSTKTIDMD